MLCGVDTIIQIPTHEMTWKTIILFLSIRGGKRHTAPSSEETHHQRNRSEVSLNQAEDQDVQPSGWSQSASHQTGECPSAFVRSGWPIMTSHDMRQGFSALPVTSPPRVHLLLLVKGRSYYKEMLLVGLKCKILDSNMHMLMYKMYIWQ